MSSRTAVITNQAPKPGPLLSQAIISGGLVFTSGSLGIDPETNQFVPGGTYERAVKAFRNLDAVLKAAGSGLHKAVKVTIFLSSMEYYSELNRAYADVFADVEPKPSRTCVSVAKLPLDAELEVEMVAAL
ncbi:hypothetical protein ASPCADRAFT_37255, partial [Aspergillus carbonarius ITEM 5010]